MRSFLDYIQFKYIFWLSRKKMRSFLDYIQFKYIFWLSRKKMRSFLDYIQFKYIPCDVLVKDVYPLKIVPNYTMIRALAHQADPTLQVYMRDLQGTVGYFRGHGVSGFCNNTPLKINLSYVSRGEWTKWIYSDNLFINKHCMKCSLHWFIMILIYNYFSHSYIYPWMDPVNPQYI